MCWKSKEIRVGNIYGATGGSYAGQVYITDGLSPTLTNMQGGGRQPMVIIGGLQKNQAVKKDGICTTLTSAMGEGGGYIPMIVKRNEMDP